MSTNQTVADLDFDFEEALDEAEDKARGNWEEQFVADLREKFSRFENLMFVSDRQVEMLMKIVDRK